MLITLFAAPRRRRAWYAAGAALLLLGSGLLLDGERWRLYGSRQALLAAQQRQGYLLVGALGRPDWPALVVGRDTGVGEVAFVTAEGQPHRYRGFPGTLKALHLRAGLLGGRGFTLVFHRPPRADADNPAFRDIR